MGTPFTVAATSPLPHLGANVQQLVKHAVRRGPQHSFPGKAADEPRDPGIGQRAACMDHPAQAVAPHGLPPPRDSPPRQ